MYCDQCGKELADDSHVCCECGAQKQAYVTEMKTANPIKIALRFSILCIAVLALVKIIITMFVHHRTELIDNIQFSIFIVWWLVYFFGNVLILNRVMSKFNKYFAEHHKEKAEWLKTIPVLGYGPLFYNHARALPFLFSDDDLGDPIVAQMKEMSRKSWGYTFGVFFSVIIFAIGFLFI